MCLNYHSKVKVSKFFLIYIFLALIHKKMNKKCIVTNLFFLNDFFLFIKEFWE